MKRFTFLLVLMFAFLQVSQAQHDPKALKMLDAMSNKYKNMKAFQATFTQTLENPSSKLQEKMSGEITVSGTKFRLKMGGQEVINNGSTMWTYLKEDNEVNISAYEPEEGEISPSQIYNIYKNGYKYYWVEEIKEGGQTYNVIELAPEDRSNPVFKVRLTINKADNTLKSWKMFKNNGNRYTYTITNFKANPPVDASTFTFDKSKYKGVKVIDLR